MRPCYGGCRKAVKGTAKKFGVSKGLEMPIANRVAGEGLFVVVEPQTPDNCLDVTQLSHIYIFNTDVTSLML